MKLTNPFSRIGISADLDAAVASSYDKISKSIEDLNASQAAAETLLNSLKATRHEDIDSAVIQKTRDVSNQILDSLKTELKLRTELLAWYPTYRTAFCEVVTSRLATSNKLASDVQAKLVELGFDARKIEPRMLDAHTDLRAKVKAYESAREYNMKLANWETGEGDPTGYKANVARIEEIRQVLALALRNAGVEVHGQISQY